MEFCCCVFPQLGLPKGVPTYSGVRWVRCAKLGFLGAGVPGVRSWPLQGRKLGAGSSGVRGRVAPPEGKLVGPGRGKA